MIDRLVTTKEAARICDRTLQNIRYTLKYAKQEWRQGRPWNYYLLSDILDLKKKNKKNLNTKPRVEKTKIKSKDDSYNVCVKPQYRGRKCPVCGVPVATGQYKCADCRVKDKADHGLVDDDYIYGGIPA